MLTYSLMQFCKVLVFQLLDLCLVEVSRVSEYNRDVRFSQVHLHKSRRYIYYIYLGGCTYMVMQLYTINCQEEIDGRSWSGRLLSGNKFTSSNQPN